MEVRNYQPPGYGQWALFITFIFLILLALLGPALGIAAFLLWREEDRIFRNHWIVGLSTIWIGAVFIFVVFGGTQFTSSSILIAWLALLLGVPSLGRLLMTLRRLALLIKPKTIHEELEETQRQRRLIAKKQHDRAVRRKSIKMGAGQLCIGSYIHGDRDYPSYMNVSIYRGWLVFQESVLDQHLFILGRSGYGKSQFLKRLIFEYLSNTDRDIFLVDGKGERDLALAVRGLAYEFGRGLAPIFRLGFGQSGAIYDGFRGAAEDIFNRLVALLGVSDTTGDARYYADINRELLQLICYAPAGVPRNFEEVARRLDKEWLLEQYKDSPAEKRVIQNYDEEKFQSFAIRLRPLVREFRQVVGQEGFALEDTRCAIFSLRTQSVGDTAKRFIEFLMEDIKDFIGKRQRRPSVLIIDEYGQFAPETILALITLARSSKLSVILATQDTSMLGDTMTKDRILNNVGTHILMNSINPEDVVKLSGTKYQVESSAHLNNGVITGQGSGRVQHTYKVDPNEVAKLRPGEAYVIRGRCVWRVQSRMIRYESRIPDQEPQKRIVRGEMNKATKVKRTQGLRLEDVM